MDRLATDRLLLREWRLDDIDDFYEFASNPNVGRNAGWRPHENKIDTLKIVTVFMQLGEMWCIVHKGTGKVIGSIGIHSDPRRRSVNAKMMGYALSEDYWGIGLMTEASEEVIRYAFEVDKLELLSIYHYPDNQRSRRVIEKCGFTYEGFLRYASRTNDGILHDELMYSMTRSEYFSALLRKAAEKASGS